MIGDAGSNATIDAAVITVFGGLVATLVAQWIASRRVKQVVPSIKETVRADMKEHVQDRTKGLDDRVVAATEIARTALSAQHTSDAFHANDDLTLASLRRTFLENQQVMTRQLNDAMRMVADCEMRSADLMSKVNELETEVTQLRGIVDRRNPDT